MDNVETILKKFYEGKLVVSIHDASEEMLADFEEMTGCRWVSGQHLWEVKFFNDNVVLNCDSFRKVTWTSRHSNRKTCVSLKKILSPPPINIKQKDIMNMFKR